MAELFDFSEVMQLSVALDRKAASIEADVGRALRKSAFDIAGTAQQLAPVDTGATRGSIFVDEVDRLQYSVGPTTEYAGYLEWGTARMAPQPFMGPAAEKHVPSLTDALGEIGASIDVKRSR